MPKVAGAKAAAVLAVTKRAATTFMVKIERKASSKGNSSLLRRLPTIEGYRRSMGIEIHVEAQGSTIDAQTSALLAVLYHPS